jgi:hypothetical protein
MVTSSLTDMFSKLLTGQASLKSALTGMIQAIGQFVVQMIAKAMALAAIKWFLRLLGFELIDGVGGVTMQRIPSQMTGGQAGKPLKLIMGGTPNPYISQGVTNRDTVPALLAQDEYVVRGQSVRDIGVPMMNEINRYGSKALSKMGKTAAMSAPSHQEMNVYLIKPEAQPQLGPRDIVLAITDDMLQGGQTKQLVRRIAQGAA